MSVRAKHLSDAHGRGGVERIDRQLPPQPQGTFSIVALEIKEEVRDGFALRPAPAVVPRAANGPALQAAEGKRHGCVCATGKSRTFARERWREQASQKGIWSSRSFAETTCNFDQ
eukprot:1374735-Pleurochrysis_carterae.AAC.3